MSIRIADLIEQLNREGNLTGPGFFHILHSANVDFTVDGIVGTDVSQYGSYSPVSYGQKYIVTDFDTWETFSTEQPLPSGWIANDIIQKGSSAWQLYLSTTNAKTEGTIVYNKHDNKFYFFDGANWIAVGTGSGGGAGVTGIGLGNDIGLTGKINITGSEDGGAGGGNIKIALDGKTITIGVSAGGQSTNVQWKNANGLLSGTNRLSYTDASTTLLVGDTSSGAAAAASASGKIVLGGSADSSFIRFADGTTQGSARSFYSLTGPTAPRFAVGISGAGNTGDRLLIATGSSANPFRTYVRYGDAWIQTNVAGVGGAGAQGNTGPSGSFDFGITFNQNTGLTHQSNDTLGEDVGKARKIMFLQDDGTLTFDFIRNYDVFKPSDFIFSVKTFTSNVSSPVLVGASNYLLSALTVTASYQFGPPITGNVYVTDPTKGTGFPVYFPTAAMDSITFSSQTLTAEAGGSLILRLEATGYTGIIGGPGRQTSTKDITISFANSFLYGVTGASSLGPNEFTGPWTTRITTNSIDQTRTVNVPIGEYIFFAYPRRLSDATFQINDLGIGGFSPQGLGGVPGVSAQTAGNLNGYVEQYLFYRSTNSGLGSNTKFDVAPVDNPELL